jgi:hypothetical protein
MDKTPYETAALTWTSQVLNQPTEITGFPRLVLWASVSRPDAVGAPPGTARLLTGFACGGSAQVAAPLAAKSLIAHERDYLHCMKTIAPRSYHYI